MAYPISTGLLSNPSSEEAQVLTYTSPLEAAVELVLMLECNGYVGKELMEMVAAETKIGNQAKSHTRQVRDILLQALSSQIVDFDGWGVSIISPYIIGSELSLVEIKIDEKNYLIITDLSDVKNKRWTILSLDANGIYRETFDPHLPQEDHCIISTVTIINPSKTRAQHLAHCFPGPDAVGPADFD